MAPERAKREGSAVPFVDGGSYAFLGLWRAMLGALLPEHLRWSAKF